MTYPQVVLRKSSGYGLPRETELEMTYPQVAQQKLQQRDAARLSRLALLEDACEVEIVNGRRYVICQLCRMAKPCECVP